MVAHLFSTAQTGYFYTTKRLRLGPPLTQIKYDPQGMPTSYNRLPGWLTNTLRSSKAEGLVCREEKEEVARTTRLYLSPIQGHCCIPYPLHSPNLHAGSHAGDTAFLFNSFYQSASAQRSNSSGGYIRARRRVLRGPQPNGTILVNVFWFPPKGYICVYIIQT